MRVNTYTQIIVAHGNTPEEFEQDFNEKMRSLDTKRTTWELKPELGWTAIITWEEDRRIMECLQDEYEARGEIYYCGQCPYMDRVNDMRRKRHPCKYADYGSTRQDSQCCSKFYQDLHDGVIEVERR